MKKILLSVLTLVSLLTSTHASRGQAPDLGAASSFGLFTALGNFNNTGATVITGDIGTHVGVITGFTPGTFTGTMHIDDDTTEAAAKDVDGAYGTLSDFGVGTVLGTTLGNEQVLTPGTFVLGAASTLAGNLYLDALGVENAEFIIKIDGPLTVSALSRVRLTNAAMWENVYWVVNGSVAMGASVAFKGTILANGNISMLANVALLGRGLTRAGTITIDNSSISMAAMPPAPLPVQLVSFTTERQNGAALLRWTTASEVKNAYFAVQSSTDGLQYHTLGRVGGHSTTGKFHAYTWTDAQVERYSARVVYYRLKQVDSDSSTHYSPVRTLSAATTAPKASLQQVQAYPSPSRLPCSLRIHTEQPGPATLRLTDALGHLVSQRQVLLAAGSNSLPLEAVNALSPGLYLLQVSQGAVRQTVRVVRE